GEPGSWPRYAVAPPEKREGTPDDSALQPGTKNAAMSFRRRFRKNVHEHAKAPHQAQSRPLPPEERAAAGAALASRAPSGRSIHRAQPGHRAKWPRASHVPGG